MICSEELNYEENYFANYLWSVERYEEYYFSMIYVRGGGMHYEEN